MKELKKKDKERLKQLIYCELYAQEQAACIPYDIQDVIHLKLMLEQLS